jgi:hypothetical protein
MGRKPSGPVRSWAGLRKIKRKGKWKPDWVVRSIRPKGIGLHMENRNFLCITFSADLN